MNYSEDLRQRASAFVARKVAALDIDTADVFSGIDWTQHDANDLYFQTLIGSKVVRATAVSSARDKARRNGEIIATLGGIPSNADELVALHARQLDVEIDWMGMIKIGSTIETVPDLKNRMRRLNANMKLGYERAGIDDATDYYVRCAIAERPAGLNAALSVRRPFDWDGLGKAFLGATDEMSHDLNVAVVKKFVWQVRRKLAGLPVTNHIMPVLHGPQGCGKTYMLRAMLAPLAEATCWSDFDQITDERNIQLWASLVIVLDEMAKAAKADIEVVKHVITADTLDRRPLYSNRTTPIANVATLIGASNHRIDELVRDETGNRRFVELIFRRAPGVKVEDFDFMAMWASVQPDDADPMLGFADDLKAAQAKFATLGPVEDWLTTARSAFWSGTATTAALYEAFCAHRRDVTSGTDYQARTQNAFSSELRRIADQRPELAISKTRKNTGMKWTRDADFPEDEDAPTPAQIKAAKITGTKVTSFPRGSA